LIDRLGMIGISWRQGGADSLAGFALSETSAVEQLKAFAGQLHLSELGYLATCNRVELIFSRSDETPLRDLRKPAFELLRGRPPIDGEAERRLKAWQGEGAAEHLFLIAAGLDSACVGETEIVGQVRECHERAIDMGLSGPVLDLVFEEAQRIAARVRGETRLGEGRVSLAEIAVQMLREHARSVAGPVALIGVSPMTQRAARSLHSAGMPMLFVNRTASKAADAAQQYRAGSLSLDAFRDNPPNVASVLAATGAPDTVLPAPTLERMASAMPAAATLLVVDMAVPPDVDAATCRKLGIRYVGMDEIVERADENRSARLIESAQAREQVDDALGTLHDRFAERYYGPLLGTLQHRYRHTAHEGVKRLLKKELKGLGDEERAAIEKWCEVLARRFAHIPCLGIRGLMHHGPDGSVEAFLSGLEPEFADELRAALGADGRSSGEHQ
jgi:glutamyl-tRNA reductase